MQTERTVEAGGEVERGASQWGEPHLKRFKSLRAHPFLGT